MRQEEQEGDVLADWVLRYVKGILVGSGFILPGVSGGALAAVFGVYERIITFLAHITRDFKRNALYLLPLGLGVLTGVFLFSFVVSFFVGAYETQILWLFVGCIAGTVPALWKQAGRAGRKKKHVAILVTAFLAGFLLMRYAAQLIGGNVPENFAIWTLAGALIGLGIIIPGLSPSNFLLYMGIYKDMADGFKGLDLMVIVPIAMGAILAVLLFSRLVDFIFKKAYAGLFHGILGVVLASTVMIIPRDYNYFGFGTLACFILCLAGVALGYWMCALEEKHKHA